MRDHPRQPGAEQPPQHHVPRPPARIDGRPPATSLDEGDELGDDDQRREGGEGHRALAGEHGRPEADCVEGRHTRLSHVPPVEACRYI